jgi:hypothetical protein
MSHHESRGESDDAEIVCAEPGLPAAVQSTETYQTDEGTVFYDAQNPAAWLQAADPVRLADRA